MIGADNTDIGSHKHTRSAAVSIPDPTFGISRGPWLPHSLICISNRAFAIRDCSLFEWDHVTTLYKRLW
jgi:hypothetical protein